MPAVERAKSPRSASAGLDPEIAPLVALYRELRPKANTTRLVQAYELAAGAHVGQRRRSGEKYITHPIGVARIVSQLGLDETTVISALLHDVVEDTDITLVDVKRLFGEDVSSIVDGLTKIERLRFDSKEEQQAATMRKMLVAMAKDTRVLIIKLADRLHNMRTLAALSAEKQQRIASETLEIYAPLANRLGMQRLRTELEDLAFAALHPTRYAGIDHMVDLRTPEQDALVRRIVNDVRSKLADAGVTSEVTGRGKHLWSIWDKMRIKGKTFDDVFDLIGIRIVVGDLRECYAAFGCIHMAYSHVPGRFKDYVGMPKFNDYQALHTTVIGPEGRQIEVQIRSQEMHDKAETGVAAHWAYKSNSGDDLSWLDHLVDSNQVNPDAQEWLDDLKTDLAPEHVFVYTPKGEVMQLPIGSTPVDFAYAVHTEVGHGCIGSRVNGRLVPLDYLLRSGETCEIVVRKTDIGGPSADWLNFVKSPRARNKIRQWELRERRGDTVASGSDELTSLLKKEGLPVDRYMKLERLDIVAVDMGYADGEAILRAIGEHHVGAAVVAHRLNRLDVGDDEAVAVSVSAATGRRRARSRAEVGVHVEGFDDVPVKLARCCLPVPGDDIMGFHTRGRGVSVHRTDCTNAVSLGEAQAVRVIDVDWDVDAGRSQFVVQVDVSAYDRPGLLRDLASVLSEHQLNIMGSSSQTNPDHISRLKFEIELADSTHLTAVIRGLRAVDGVFEAARIMPHAHPSNNPDRAPRTH